MRGIKPSFAANSNLPATLGCMSSPNPTPMFKAGMSGDRALSGQAARELRLLLIEDSAFDATMISRLLGQAGFAIQSTRVEDEAALRAALEAGHWDAVISDHYLPEFNSTDALR